MTYIREAVRLPSDDVVERFNVGGAGWDGKEFVIYSAWEPADGHATTTTIAGRCYGRVGSRRPPAAVEALPADSHERQRAVLAWQRAEYERAYRLIESAYGPLVTARRSMGAIERREACPVEGRTERPPHAKCRDLLHVCLDRSGELADSTDARCGWCGGWVQTDRVCPAVPKGVVLQETRSVTEERARR